MVIMKQFISSNILSSYGLCHITLLFCTISLHMSFIFSLGLISECWVHFSVLTFSRASSSLRSQAHFWVPSSVRLQKTLLTFSASSYLYSAKLVGTTQEDRQLQGKVASNVRLVSMNSSSLWDLGPLSMVSLRALQNFKQILKKCFVKVVKILLVERPVNTSLSQPKVFTLSVYGEVK